MKFLSPQSGMRYSILNTNHRTSRNELTELAKMVSIFFQRRSNQYGPNLNLIIPNFS